MNLSQSRCKIAAEKQHYTFSTHSIDGFLQTWRPVWKQNYNLRAYFQQSFEKIQKKVNSFQGAYTSDSRTRLTGCRLSFIQDNNKLITFEPSYRWYLKKMVANCVRCGRLTISAKCSRNAREGVGLLCPAILSTEVALCPYSTGYHVPLNQASLQPSEIVINSLLLSIWHLLLSIAASLFPSWRGGPVPHCLRTQQGLEPRISIPYCASRAY